MFMRESKSFKLRCGVCAACLILFWSAQGFPYATSTHKLINKLAAQYGADIDNFLINELNLGSGLFTSIKNSWPVGSTVLDWIGEGGVQEDTLWLNEYTGAGRGLKHFHDPMRSWDKAGFGGTFQSSVRWAQNKNQIPGRNSSWFDGRNSYLAALTASTEQARSAKFAEMFQTIGQVMHLISDQSVILHTRDEGHANPFAHTYESYVAANPQLVKGYIGFDPSILQWSTGDSSAPVPIANLFDTNIYNGTNPPGDAADQQIGLAEFTNANFFSPATIMTLPGQNLDYPLPALIDLVKNPTPVPDPRTGRLRKYRSKIGQGATVDHIVREGLWNGKTNGLLPDEFDLDDVCYKDYADKLLPRAIGYSAGIINYFFRGRIKIEAPDRHAYALAEYQSGNAGYFRRFHFKVSNITSYPNTGENTSGAGQMWAVVRYRKPLSGNIFENPSTAVGDPLYAVSAPQTIDLTRAPQEVYFDFAAGQQVPTNSADIFLTVIWKGKLGQEEGAIMVGSKDLLEPDPLTFGNSTDYDCFQANLYHVADLSMYPQYNPPAQTQRDVTGDGQQDLFGAFTDYSIYIKTYNSSNPQIASPTYYDFGVDTQAAPPTPGPQYSRFVLLQDQPSYGFSWRVGSSLDIPTGATYSTPRNFDFVVSANRNDFVVDPQTGKLTRRITESMVYRGVSTFCIFIMVYDGYPRFQPCIPQSFYLPETFNLVSGYIREP